MGGRGAAGVVGAGQQGAGDNRTTSWFWGASCRGHFMTAQWEQLDAGSNATSLRRLLACEGGWRSVAVSVATCPVTHTTVKNMQGSWVLGTASVITARPTPQPTPQPQPSGGDPVPSLSIRERPEWNDKVSMALAQRMDAAAASPSVEADPRRAVFSVEERSDGAGGTWRLTRRLDPRERDALAGGMSQEEVEEEVEAAFAPSWRDWLPSPPPPPPHGKDGNPPPHGKEGKDGRGCPHHGGGWSAQCNGHDAWLHGELPCFGNFTLAIKHKPMPPPPRTATVAAVAATATARRLRANGAAHLAVIHTKHALPGEVEEGAAALTVARSGPGGPHPGSNVTFALTAECDGLWTGFLGHACHGLSTAHVQVAGQGSGRGGDGGGDQQAQGNWGMDAWDVCSGGKRVRHVHRAGARGMSTVCHGKSASHKTLHHTPRPAPSAPRSA